jgi:hypothetical protein
MQDNAERTLLQGDRNEVHDISLGAFRFISALCAAALVLMIAGLL